MNSCVEGASSDILCPPNCSPCIPVIPGLAEADIDGGADTTEGEADDAGGGGEVNGLVIASGVVDKP